MKLNVEDGTIIKRPLYREEISNMLKEKILSGELKPGDKIVETRWAKELGISQAPVREAIRELEVIGLVENKPYQGAYVRAVTMEEVRDSYILRKHLETIGLHDAIQQITKEQLLEIKNALDSMKKAAKKSDFKQFIYLNTLFHQKIIEVSKNKLLIRLWHQCNINELAYIGTKHVKEGLVDLANRHDLLYDTLISKDYEKAEIEIKKHFDELIDKLE